MDVLNKKFEEKYIIILRCKISKGFWFWDKMATLNVSLPIENNKDI